MDSEFEFEYLPWQVEALNRLLDLHRQNHLPHAILLESTSREDISAFTRYLAMALLCENLEGQTLCGSCDACRMMPAGTYADFSWVTLEVDEQFKKINKNIKIEQIRNLIHEVGLTSRYGRLKIAVIYPAEKMNVASANALLKTLEEPGDDVLLMLATHNPGRIPVTLRSRCQTLTINLPDTEMARTWLEEQQFDNEDIPRYLDFANGDPVLALRLRQQGYADIVQSFKARLVQFLRGEIAVAELCNELLGNENDLIRRLIDMTLRAYQFQMCGIDTDANHAGPVNPESAQAISDLQLQAQSQLGVEENNLDLQLQLEDVLISLKQILTRRQL